jgi:hypothetical protein
MFSCEDCVQVMVEALIFFAFMFAAGSAARMLFGRQTVMLIAEGRIDERKGFVKYVTHHVPMDADTHRKLVTAIYSGWHVDD